MCWLLLNSACTTSKSSLFLLLTPQQAEWGVSKSLGGTQLEQWSQTDWRDIPYYTTSYSTIKFWGKFFKVTIAWRLLEYLSAGSDFCITCFSFFPSSIKPFLFWPTRFCPSDSLFYVTVAGAMSEQPTRANTLQAGSHVTTLTSKTVVTRLWAFQTWESVAAQYCVDTSSPSEMDW